VQRTIRLTSELLQGNDSLKEALQLGASEEGLDLAVCDELLCYLLVQRRLEKLPALV
jgi:hypothetical protein